MDKEFQSFTINDLFKIRPGKRLVAADSTLGTRPFIGALDSNNGVVRFVSDSNESLDSNVLGVNYNGNGMVISFYHPYECIFSDDVKRFHLRNTLDGRDVLLYVKVPILMQKSKFGYLYKFNAQRMENTKIMLPATSDGEPDWDYMSSYSVEKRGGLLMRYRQYLDGRLSELEYKDVPALDEVEWKAFSVSELFTRIVSTKGKTTSQLIAGNDVPYIAAAKNNNGCAGVFSAKEYPEWVSEGNCIVFVQLGDGAAGIAHYVPMDFIGMNGKTSCGYIDGQLNGFNGLFIAKALSANKVMFSHGHSWTGRRLLKSRCMLPVMSNDKPDYEYMTQYVKNMMLCKYQQYLDYLDSQVVQDMDTD